MENESSLRLVWQGNSQTECVEICEDLQKAKIRYRTSQRPVSRYGRMRVLWKFEVYVSDFDYQAAKETLGTEKEEGCEEAAFALEDSPSPPPDPDTVEPSRVEAYLKRWKAQEAAVKVGEQDGSDESSIVELSLSENLIHYRVERSADGKREYFVRAEDEVRAREIFREINRGEPPR